MNGQITTSTSAVRSAKKLDISLIIKRHDTVIAKLDSSHFLNTVWFL